MYVRCTRDMKRHLGGIQEYCVEEAFRSIDQRRHSGAFWSILRQRVYSGCSVHGGYLGGSVKKGLSGGRQPVWEASGVGGNPGVMKTAKCTC